MSGTAATREAYPVALLELVEQGVDGPFDELRPFTRFAFGLREFTRQVQPRPEIAQEK